MKRRVGCLVCLLALLVLNANAQKIGFNGPGAASITVAEALKLRDEAPVTLQGKIVLQLGNEKYQFQDNTGTIIVEIDNEKWRNLSVDQNDMVEISGEIDKGLLKGIEVDVDFIRKL